MRRYTSSCLGVAVSFFLVSLAHDTQAQSICDRTSAVRAEILHQIGVAGLTCGAVTSSQLSSISTLDLEDERIALLQEDDFDGLSGLAVLELAQNRLNSLPEDLFEDLTSLTTLRLNGNNLRSLPEDLFDGLTSLSTLDLDNNDLTALPEDLFDGLTSLQNLYIDFNPFTTLPEDLFDGLNSLTVLSMDNIHFTTLPEDLFEGLSNLTGLDLWSNRLTTLPEDLFDGLRNLEWLLLNNNFLTTLDEDLFSDLFSLEDLYLFDNRLTALPEDLLDGLSNLKRLYVFSNSLTTLPENIFEDIEAGLEVDLTDNPIDCLPQTILDLESEGTITITINPIKRPIEACPVPPPVVTLELSSTSISEAGGSTTLTANLNDPSREETTITVSVVPDFPATDRDYSLSLNKVLTIAAGETTSTGEVTITAVDNNTDAPDKTVQVGGMAENTIGVTGPEDVELTIEDDDEASGITLTASPPSVGESDAATTVTVTARMNAVRSEETLFTLSVGSGTAISGTDFAAVDDFSITISAGSTAGTGTFVLTPVNDFIVEPDETVTISGSSSALGADRTEVHVTIVDDDEPIFLAIRDLTVQEDAGVARVQVDVTPAAPTELRVTYQTTPQTATAGLDYTSSRGTLEIPAGSTTAVIDVPITDDAFMESSETFQVRLSDAVGAVLNRDEATVTIEDNDVYRLRVLDASAIESASALTFAVTLDTPHPAEVVRVDYETVDGTAMATADYVQQRGTLEFPIGAVRREVSVPLIDDTEEEPPEAFLFRLSEPAHALLADAEATGTIRDDDALPVVNIVSSLAVAEDVGRARFAVTRSRVLPGRDTEVSFTVTDESAEAPVDYQVLTSSPVRITSGETTAFVEVQIIDDAILEADETFRVQLTDAQNGVLGQFEGRGTIVDNEDPVTVSIQDVEVTESAGEAIFPVVLSGLVSTPRTFTYVTEDETAAAGQDYETAAGTVTFATGALRQEVRVPILDDLETEETETFLVRLSGAGILDGEGRGTIQDDDAPLTVSIHDGSASEGAGSLRLPVRLNRASSRVITVQFVSSDETASASSDYGASRGIVIFEQGTTEGSILVEVVEDTEVESEETFQVTLSNARHAAIVRGVGTGTILDNEGSTAVSVQGVTVRRRAATFEVRLSMASPLPVTVSYASEDGSAKAGQDYEPRAGAITFAPGEVSKTVEVKLLSSEPAWHAKTFSLVLLSAVNAELQTARKEAVMEEEVEKNVLDAYVSRVLRTGASHVVESLSRRTEGLSQCRVPELSWLRYGTWRPSAGELFAGCGAMFTQAGWSVWGQGAFTRLHGMEGALSLRSDVTTMLVGADHVWSSGWMAGVLAAHSLGRGSYEVTAQSGTASSRLTGVYPYVSYQTGAGMRTWLLMGLGRGDAEVDTLESDLGAGLVALGLTGTLTRGAAGRLGYEADILMAAAEVAESSSRLWVRRVRTGIEGSLHWGPAIQPYVEAALRHDSGDAETGLGLELGGGMRWSASRLRAEVGGRTLAVHTAEGMREWGLMAAVEYGDAGGLGPTAKVRPMWGSVYGGDLWRDEPIQYVGQGVMDQRMEMELGYGTRLRKSLGRSIVGMTLDQRGRAYRIGYNLHMTQGLQFSVTARAIDANQTPRAYGLSARMNLKW